MNKIKISRGKPKYLEKNITYHFPCHKLYINLPCNWTQV